MAITVPTGWAAACATRLDLIEAASPENGCIDKFRVWVEMEIPEPVPLSYAVLTCPVAVQPANIPYFDVAYNPAPSYVWPFDKNAELKPAFSGFNQISRSGYATFNGLASGDIVEFWFHRSMPDMSTPAFSAEFLTPPTGLFIWHYSQPTGTAISFKSRYQYGLDNFFQAVYDTIFTNTIILAEVSCSSSSSGGTAWTPVTAECPSWAVQATDCPSWTAQSTDCPTWAKGDEPI